MTSEDLDTPEETRVRQALRWLRSDSGARFRGWLLILAPLMIWAAAVWPAVMVADSVDTWTQAVDGPVLSWHVPLYTYLQRLSHLIVGSPWGVTLLQCMVLAWTARRLLDVAIEMGARRWPVYWFGAFVALTPAMGVLPSHILKDVPYTIAFLIVLEFLVREVNRCWTESEDASPSTARYALLVAGLAGLALMRSNGPLVALVAGATIVLISTPKKRAILAVGGAAMTFVLVTSLILPAVGVKKARIGGGAPYSFGLRHLYAERPEQVPPKIVEHFNNYGTQEEFAAGDDCHWAGTKFQDRFYRPTRINRSEIRAAWLSAVIDDPIYIASKYLCAAAPAWNPLPSEDERTYYQTLWDVVRDNPQNIESAPLSNDLKNTARHVLLRLGRTNANHRAWNPWITQTLFWRPATWMYALAGLLVVGGIRYARWRSLWVLTIFAAQATSVVIMAGAHYRYMAPAWIGALMLVPYGWMLATRGRLRPRQVHTDRVSNSEDRNEDGVRENHDESEAIGSAETDRAGADSSVSQAPD